jgi:hypothetical protein
MRMVVELEGYNGFEELYKNSWSGAIDRLDTIKQYHMEEEFMEHLDMVFKCCEELPTDEQVNNYIWFELDAEQFVGVKGFKAKGKRLSTWQIESITELEPVRFPENNEEEEDTDSTENEENLDPDSGKSQQQVIDEMTGQLRLFPDEE